MSDKIKLLYISEPLGGGVFSYLVDLSNRLADTFDITIAHGIRDETPENYQEYFDKRIRLVKVDNFTRSLSAGSDFKAFSELKKIAEQVKPDIIHLHSSKAGALGRWAFNGRKLPIFYTPHGYSFLMQDQSAIKKFVYKFAEQISAKRCATTISCSEGEHNETLKLTKRAVYINNGINLGDLDEMVNSVGNEKKSGASVFTLGRICAQKNPKLFNNIALAMPDIKFTWIGDGDLRNELTAPNITVTGWVDRRTAIKASLESDVFLLPSLWEGLPISLLESMYLKKLCVVSDIIGNRDVIENGVNGFVCNSIAEYTAAIRAANSSDELRNRAHNDVLSDYNTNVMAQRYSEMYRKALGDRSRKANLAADEV